MQEAHVPPVRSLIVNEELPTNQVVHFNGNTFADLKERLVAASVPGNKVRVLLSDKWTVPLDEEALPTGDLLSGPRTPVRGVSASWKVNRAVCQRHGSACLTIDSAQESKVPDIFWPNRPSQLPLS